MTKEELKALRVSLNLTQDEFAHRLGLTGETVWRYENGKSLIPPSVTTLAHIIMAMRTRGISRDEKLRRISVIIHMDKDLEECSSS